MQQALDKASQNPPVVLGDGGYHVRPLTAVLHGRQLAAVAGRQWVSHEPFDGARVGRVAADAIRLRATGGPSIEVRRVNAAATTGKLHDGVIEFDPASPGVRARVYATDTGVEDLLTIESPSALPGYELTVPAGWRLSSATQIPGLVELKDDRGSARLRVWARAAWDAMGAQIPVALEVEGSRIAVRVESSAVWPVLVDPEFMGAGTMLMARAAPALVQLASGKVLVIGGDAWSKQPSGLCELYDPITATFTATGMLHAPKVSYSGHLLATGQVLVMGQTTPSYANILPHSAAELYDPSTGTFLALSDSSSGYTGMISEPLLDGRVLVSGGIKSAKTELWDPDSQKFAPAGSMLQWRIEHTQTLLPSGRILVAGGGQYENHPLDTAEYFDAPTKSFAAGPTLTGPREAHSATLLPDGQVALVGGLGNDWKTLRSVDVVDPGALIATPGPRMRQARAGHGAALLPDGSVIVFGGGNDDTSALDTSEVFPAAVWSAPGREATPGPQLTHARTGASSVVLADGRVLVVGSSDSSASAVTAEMGLPQILLNS